MENKKEYHKKINKKKLKVTEITYFYSETLFNSLRINIFLLNYNLNTNDLTYSFGTITVT